MSSVTKSSIEKGVETIRAYVRSLPVSPGVYRMVSASGDVLYVGKAKALKKRVSSYTQFENLPYRLKHMVSMTASMEFVNTSTEADALLLEADLIKRYRPPFNILLRDDKSFPYIVLRTDHEFPQILKHRGARNIKGEYFGPFPSAGDVNRTITILQRAFLLRNCNDSYFQNRSRPCLQYHIKRCTAPCVGYSTKEEYLEQVQGAREFMNGKSREVQDRLTQKMKQASKNTDYEKAAQFRDRIRALTSIQSTHEMNLDVGDADLIAITKEGGESCVEVFFYRGGRNLGNRSYFPRHHEEEDESTILSAFLAQFYQGKSVPPKIILNHNVDDSNLLEQALAERALNSVSISVPKRGKYKNLIDLVNKNAQESLKRSRSQSASRRILREGVMELFDMDDIPARIEVYDNSHISGTNMVGAMIVEGETGFEKKSYRKFNIKVAKASDDYGMMREVLSRRFKNMLKEGGDDSRNWPELVLIDGGLGQLNAAKDTLEDAGILDQITVVAIAKGPDRNAGREKFFMLGKSPFQLSPDDPVLHYLQRLRDEAHRFAVGSHRARRSKEIKASSLDEIGGVGAKRKKSLLLHFGSAKAVEAAGVKDLAKVEGISKALAQKIYDYFHGD